MKQTLRPFGRRRQRGATAVEFAIVFPLFFLIFYALVTFGLIFAVQQNLTLAASEGARAALNYASGSSPALALGARAANARTVATNLTKWLPNVSVPLPSTPTQCSYDSTVYCITVTVSYPYATSPLIPTLPLLDIALPSTLSSAATVQIPPSAL